MLGGSGALTGWRPADTTTATSRTNVAHETATGSARQPGTRRSCYPAPSRSGLAGDIKE